MNTCPTQISNWNALERSLREIRSSAILDPKVTPYSCALTYTLDAVLKTPERWLSSPTQQQAVVYKIEGHAFLTALYLLPPGTFLWLILHLPGSGTLGSSSSLPSPFYELELAHAFTLRYLGPVPHDAKYYVGCMLAGALACGVTHAGMTPIDVTKCNMQVCSRMLSTRFPRFSPCSRCAVHICSIGSVSQHSQPLCGAAGT